MTKEEIKIKRKVKKLVHGMLKNMTLQDGIEAAETIIFCLRKLPDCEKEGLIDSCMKAMNGVCRNE